MNPAFLGSLTGCKHVRVFSEVLKRLSVLLGFLNLHDFSLKKAQISLHLEINSHLVEECNITWHWLFVISLTQTNSDCNLETFVEWCGVSHQRGDEDIVYWFSQSFLSLRGLWYWSRKYAFLSLSPSAMTSQHLVFHFYCCSASLGLEALSRWFLMACD